jgi:LysR family glycine cleavage system transcriptional activator
MLIERHNKRGGLRLPSTEALRAFEAVARLGSFERAARELNVTAGAIRKRANTLEELVGTALFERRSNAILPTAAGLRYLESVKQILELMCALPSFGQADQVPTRLRITATPTFARQILAPNLAGFANLHSHIELELIVVPPVFDYPSTNAEVEIRAGDATQYGGIPLTRDMATPMASPLLLKTLPPIRTPADLRGAPLIRTPLEPWQPWFQATLLDWAEPTQGPKLQDLGLTYEAAAKGHGVALCRLSLVKDWLVNDHLRPLFNVYSLPTNQYYALANTHTPEVRLFVQWLQSICSEEADRGQEIAQFAYEKHCLSTRMPDEAQNGMLGV